MIWKSTWSPVLCTEATACPSPALAATSPQNWREEAVSIQRSSPGGGPGLLILSPRLSLHQPPWCPCSGELRKDSYSPMSPHWDTEVTCGMASPRACGRFWGQGCLIKAFPICSRKVMCRSYVSAREKTAVAVTEYGFIFIHLNMANHYNTCNL